MSHAVIVVALSPTQIEEAGDVHDAVAYQMEPFSENNEMFADGSRWDWWVIGGRWSGFFKPSYDAYKDPDNQEICSLCHGTGLRNDELGKRERERNPAYTCNGCGGKGKSTRWSLVDKYNIITRGELTENYLRAENLLALENQWVALHEDQELNIKLFATEAWRAERIFSSEKPHDSGWYPGCDKAAWIEKNLDACISAYGFLKDRIWYERERLGWFGCAAKTECEIAAAEQGHDYTGRCIHTCGQTGAKIVTFSESEEDNKNDRWSKLYWARFIRPLPPETTLVAVDYHV